MVFFEAETAAKKRFYVMIDRDHIAGLKGERFPSWEEPTDDCSELTKRLDLSVRHHPDGDGHFVWIEDENGKVMPGGLDAATEHLKSQRVQSFDVNADALLSYIRFRREEDIDREYQCESYKRDIRLRKEIDVHAIAYWCQLFCILDTRRLLTDSHFDAWSIGPVIGPLFDKSEWPKDPVVGRLLDKSELFDLSDLDCDKEVYLGVKRCVDRLVNQADYILRDRVRSTKPYKEQRRALRSGSDKRIPNESLFDYIDTIRDVHQDWFVSFAFECK